MKNGVFVLDKPKGFTSFDAIAVLRGLFKTKKIGHTGTLDPMATGVLVVLIGGATKALSFLGDTEKAYEADFLFGMETDTQDSSGTVLKESSAAVSLEKLEAVLPSFRGDILQIPPMYSAVSKDGQRLYALARQGIEVEREPRPVRIDRLELIEYNEEERRGKMAVECSKGTYIRTLCADIGEKAGSGGIMTALRRTSACGFTLQDAITIEEARALAEKGEIYSVLRPVEDLFTHLERVDITAAQAIRFQNGGQLDLNRLRISAKKKKDGEQKRVYGPNGFIGLGRVDTEKNELAVLKLLNREE